MVLAGPTSETRVRLDEPDLSIERRALIQSLAERAARSGVTIELNRRFLGIRPTGEGAELEFRTAQGERVRVTARDVIGADGVFSDVAKAVGLAHPPSVPILQAEIELPSAWDSNVTQVWFDTEDTRFFYWLIPESATGAVVGLVGDERARMRQLLRHFLDRKGFKALAYQGARIALYHPRLQTSVKVGEARVLLVGDAAGQVKVTTVGGTVSGLLGATAAVRAILLNRSYAAELRGVERELRLHWWMRAALDRFDSIDYDRLVRAVSPRARKFLGANNRDEMAGVAWQFLFVQPGLATIVPALVLKSFTRRRSGRALTAPAQD
jgi:flavin-dependent dehydrogenase